MPKIALGAPSGFNSVESSYYLWDLRNNKFLTIRFPPKSVSENPGSPGFSSDTAVGRTNQIVNWIYNNNRTMSVQIVFVDDYYTEPMTYIRDVISSFEYPDFSKGYAVPPNIQMRLGALVIRGVMKDLELNWEGQIRAGIYTRLNASFTMTECRDIPLGSSEILNGGLGINDTQNTATVQNSPWVVPKLTQGQSYSFEQLDGSVVTINNTNKGTGITIR